MVEFNSVVDAARRAIAIQREMPEHSADMPKERRILFRVAINVGDVVSDGDLIYGMASPSPPTWKARPSPVE